MNLRIFSSALIVLGLGAGLVTPTQPQSTPKFALLVAITRYTPQQELEPLEGCLNDVAAVKSALIKNFGFRPQNILVLTNEKATRRGVVTGIRSQLLANARKYPKGTFLFYYSGHGSTTPDVNGDEKVADPTDTEDETLVTFDSTRNPKDREHFDLVDDDTERLFNAIRSVKGFTGSLTSILDSCHSGTATRGDTSQLPRVREAKPDTRRYPPSSLVADLPLNAVTTGSFAAFSGCMATESSMEADFPVEVQGKDTTRVHGALTYYLLQAMVNATKSTTNNQIWAQLSRQLSAKYSQNPQLEGKSNGLFLGGASRDEAPPITYTLTDRKLTFPRGIEAGAVKGGFVALYASGAKTRGSAPMEQYQITAARLGESEVIVPSDSKIPPQGKIRLLTPFFGSEALLVSLDDHLSAANPVVKRLAAFYNAANSNYVRLARAGETADVTLSYSSQGVAYTPKDQDPKRLSQAVPHPLQMGYYVSLGSGKKPLFNVFLNAKDSGDISSENELRLRQTLENYAVQRNILALSNSLDSGKSPAQAIKITPYRVAGTVVNGKWQQNDGDGALTPIDILPRAKLKVDERLQFEFDNKGTKKLYVALLWLAQDGSVTVLEDADERKVLVLAPRSQPKHSAHTTVFRVSPPIGEENIKVVVSTQPIETFYLERPPVDQEPAPTPRGAMSPFDLIAAQVTGLRGFTIQREPVEFSSWGTETIGLSISE